MSDLSIVILKFRFVDSKKHCFIDLSKMNFYSQTLFCFLIIVTGAFCENKYSRPSNEKKKSDVDFRNLEKPFRMNKLNLLWTKARQRLTEPKLKSLYSDLMIQDKEELIYKKVKSEGGDKEGLKETELRRKLTSIMSAYGLLHHFDPDAAKEKDHPAYNSAMDDYINKSIFKDKKLNYLWTKAEASGFTMEELLALREEFTHHQEKIDQYYDLFDDESPKDDSFKNVINEEDLDKFNEISAHTNEMTKDYIDKANLIREKHRDLRDGYDRLQRVIAKAPNNKEFIEPKVQGLWKIAVSANFTTEELASLKVELQHYESRLLKLRHLQANNVSNREKHKSKVAGAGDKMNHFEEQEQMIKKHSRKVAKLHADLESKILERHTEL